MKVHFDFPELGLAGFFLLLSCWYLTDSFLASSSVENLLLILPAATIVIVLCCWIIGRTVYKFYKSRADDVADREANKTEKKPVSVFGAMCILAGFVFSMDWIGFDVATFLFMAGLMFLQGERRIFWLGGFSLVFAILVSLFFEYMIPYPMPMLLGKGLLEKLL